MKTGRPSKKIYDPMAVMEELLSTVDAVLEEKQEIKVTATELDLSELKVRKLLITSGKLHYPQKGEIQGLQRVGKNMDQIQIILGLSRASINAYLPYSKVPYKESEVSANADRCEMYRKRKAAVEQIMDADTLWNTLVQPVSGARNGNEQLMEEKGKYYQLYTGNAISA